MTAPRRSASGALLALAVAGPATGQSTVLISMWTDGTQSNSASQFPAISTTGRHIFFPSQNSNWSPGASGWQVYARDRDPDDNGVFDEGNEVTTLISIGIDGLPGDGSSGGFNGHFGVAISGDGRYVMWQSQSTNLTSHGVQGLPWYHVYMRDRDPDDNGVFDEGNGVTQLVNLNQSGLPSNNSGNGTLRLALSADGRCAAFSSNSTDLVSDLDTNNTFDVFVRDVVAGTTERISQGHDGSPPNNASAFPSLSSDGRSVGFVSTANNLTPGEPLDFIWDVYVYDRQTQTTEKASVSTSGAHGDNHSGTGAYSNYTGPMISPDGRFIAFDSTATNLVTPDTNFLWDVFLRDLDAGTTIRVSSTSTGGLPDNGSNNPSISTNGRYVTFGSNAKLIPEDTDSRPDIYSYDTTTGELERISISDSGGNTNGFNFWPAITPDGSQVAFTSSASNLGPTDTNGQYDVYVRNRRLPAACPADVAGGDGVVDVNDLLLLLGTWGPCPGPCPPHCAGDIDEDCEVGVTDLLVLLGAWGPC